MKKVGLETIVALQVMQDLLKKHQFKWLALAAPQVGCPQRFFVSGFLETPIGYRVYINPKITKLHSEPPEDVYDEESCVSIPGIKVSVPRWQRVYLEYETLERQKRTVILDGMQARVVQHEVDHLDGKLITDYE